MVPQTPFMQFPSLAGVVGLAHAFITKPYNLAPHTGSEQEQAVPRRKEVCAALRLDFDRLTCPQQVHGVNVARVGPANAGAGRDGRDTAIADCDGLITDVPGVPLVAFSADCGLLLIVDPAAHALGLIHAGWRGVAGGAGRVLVEQMRQAYGAEPGRMLAAIAPAAQPCCYEISDDLADQLAACPQVGRDMLSCHGDRRHLDMHAALARQLEQSGLAGSRIELMSACTICDERFFSYRREGAATGRNALLAGWMS
jgi:hypothetical protein